MLNSNPGIVCILLEWKPLHVIIFYESNQCNGDAIAHAHTTCCMLKPHLLLSIKMFWKLQSALSPSPDSLLTKSRVSFVVHEGYQPTCILGTDLSWNCAKSSSKAYDSVTSPTVAVRGLFFSCLCDDRDQIAAVFVIAQSYAICCITTQHLISTRKFTSWNCFDSNCVQTRFETIFLLAFYQNKQGNKNSRNRIVLHQIGSYIVFD